ncbi:MAG: hypothetical protein Q9160_004333 [Pyrenula sp. 1 TL-2023]
MPPSLLPTSSTHLTPTFTESAGAILFRLSTHPHQICIIHHPPSSEYLLPKGRRNISETAPQAALREVTEETGFPRRLLPVNMPTRAPPADDQQQQQMPNGARELEGICEPVAVQIRQLNEGNGNVKVIWWYVAAVNEDEPVRGNLLAREEFVPEFYGHEEVGEKLTFRGDQEVVRKAVEIVERTYGTEAA